MPRKALTLPLGHPWFLTIYPKKWSGRIVCGGKGFGLGFGFCCCFCFWGTQQFTPFLEKLFLRLWGVCSDSVFSCVPSPQLPGRPSFGKKCAKFAGVVYGAFELRYCLEVCFSISRLKKFQLRGSSTSRFLLNKLQRHVLPPPLSVTLSASVCLPLCYAKTVSRKRVCTPAMPPCLSLPRASNLSTQVLK